MRNPIPVDAGSPHAGATRRHILGHPVAYAATASLLLVLFGWTFFTSPGRPAPADDPAYYTWRAEALLENDPATVLGITGPLEMYSGGYRVATPVLGALMRRVADVAPVTPTVVLAVGLRVLIPLLLAALALRLWRDPLVWHVVALASASLLLTPPFGGYLDNVLTLLFLGASLFVLDAARASWRGRSVLFALLVVGGMTHPTTVGMFVAVLVLASAVRAVARDQAVRGGLARDGWVVATAAASSLAVYVVWKVGLWGPAASFGDAALPPPAGAAFFKQRLDDWVAALRPAVNAPLFLVGVAAIAVRLRRGQDDTARLLLLWLLPLVGVTGFVAGVAYPYYRFFNTTLAWVLFVGAGAYVSLRFFMRYQGAARSLVSAAGVLAIGAIVVTNFGAGFRSSGWNDVRDAWLKPEQRAELRSVQRDLAARPDDQPVVFVVDDAAVEPVRIYGFAKLAGNVTRYGVPAAMQERAALYLGSVESFRLRRPTDRADDPYYRALSAATLSDVDRVLAAAGATEPVVIVPRTFNRTGSNSDFVTVPRSEPRRPMAPGAPVVPEETLLELQTGPADPDLGGSWLLLALFVAPGWLVFRAVVPEGGIADALGLVPAFGAAVLALATIVVLAITDQPLDAVAAWVSAAVAVAASAALHLRSWRSRRTAG